MDGLACAAIDSGPASDARSPRASRSPRSSDGRQKTQRVTVAIVHDAQFLVEQSIVRATDVRGPIRAGRVYGWYFLPSCLECELSESVVDLRQLYTIPREVLDSLCAAGRRKARIQPLYREHLAKHFADTFSRIGLPEPYETE